MLQFFKGLLGMNSNSPSAAVDVVPVDEPQEARNRGDLLWFYGKITPEHLKDWNSHIKGLTHTISDSEKVAIQAIREAEFQGNSYTWRRAVLIWVEFVDGYGRNWHEATPRLVKLIEDFDTVHDWEIGRRVASGMMSRGWWTCLPAHAFDAYVFALFTLLGRIAPSETHHLLSLEIVSHLRDLVVQDVGIDKHVLANQCSTCLLTWEERKWPWRIAHDLAILAIQCGHYSPAAEDALLRPSMMRDREFTTHIQRVLLDISKAPPDNLQRIREQVDCAMERMLRTIPEAGLSQVVFPECGAAVEAIIRSAQACQNSTRILQCVKERALCEEIRDFLRDAGFISDTEVHSRNHACDVSVAMGRTSRCIAEAKIWSGPDSAIRALDDIIQRQCETVPVSVMLLFLRKEDSGIVLSKTAHALRNTAGYVYRGPSQHVLGFPVHRISAAGSQRVFTVVVVPVELRNRVGNSNKGL